METYTITDAEGNRTTFNTKTNEIIKTIDKHGFIYDAEGNRTGNVHGHEYMDGQFYE